MGRVAVAVGRVAVVVRRRGSRRPTWDSGAGPSPPARIPFFDRAPADGAGGGGGEPERTAIGPVVGAAPAGALLLALSIVAVVSLVMARMAGFHAIGAAMGDVYPEWVALLIGARLAAYAGYAGAHRETLSRRRGPKIPADRNLELVAFGAGATSLGGGFATDRRAMRGAGVSPRQATARVLNLGALEWATLAPAAWISALWLLGSPQVNPAMSVPWVLGVPLGCAAAAFFTWRFPLSPRQTGSARAGSAHGRRSAQPAARAADSSASKRDRLAGHDPLLGGRDRLTVGGPAPVRTSLFSRRGHSRICDRACAYASKHAAGRSRRYGGAACGRADVARAAACSRTARGTRLPDRASHARDPAGVARARARAPTHQRGARRIFVIRYRRAAPSASTVPGAGSPRVAGRSVQAHR